MSDNIHNDKLILENKYSSILLKFSFLLGINSVMGFYKYLYHNMEYYDVLITNTLLFISSINYWRHPISGFRRNFDISMCLINLIYNTYTVSNHPISYFHIISVGGPPIFYIVSWICYNLNYRNASTFFHCVCHFTANVGIYVIYNVELLYMKEYMLFNSSSDMKNKF
jgi:hypothetical protein